MSYGVCDEYSRLLRVLVRRPGEEFVNPEQWRLWGYPGSPDLEKAQAEHDAFTAILREEGVEVIYIKDVPVDRREAIFTHDSTIMTPAGAIVCRSGNPLRDGEGNYAAKALLDAGVPILYTVHGAARVDGGDTLWLDEETFLVGRSYRTNDEAYKQIKAVMEGVVCRRVVQVPLPHYRGPGHVLHLMSLISPVDRDLAVVYLPLMPVWLVELLMEKNVRMIEVPDEEFETLGCNVLAVAPRRVIIHEGNPVTERKLKENGCVVYTYRGEQISVIPTGGPTCLTRPILRQNLAS